jgi:allophanate hydrolase
VFPEAIRIGVPRREQLEFFGDDQAAALYDASIDRLGALGAVPVAIDFAPFHDAAALLYSGPWIAERYAAVGEFIERGAADVDPVVREIILGGKRVSGSEAFRGLYRLAELRRAAEAEWRRMDVLVANSEWPVIVSSWAMPGVQPIQDEPGSRTGVGLAPSILAVVAYRR